MINKASCFFLFFISLSLSNITKGQENKNEPIDTTEQEASLNTAPTINRDQTHINCEENPDHAVDIRNDPGGSLNGMTTQNQDGLGTCYANSTSLLVQAELGTPISYQQMAIYANTAAVPKIGRNRGMRERTDADGNIVMRDFTYGGWSCRTFNALKNRGVPACNPDDVPVESLSNPWNQLEIMNSLSTLYDAATDMGSDNRETLRNILLELAENHTEEGEDLCAISSSEEYVPIEMQSYIQRKCIDEHNNIRNLNSRTEIINLNINNLTRQLGFSSQDDERERLENSLNTYQRELTELNQDIVRATNNLERFGTVTDDTNVNRNSNNTGQNFHKKISINNRVTCNLRPEIINYLQTTYRNTLVTEFESGASRDLNNTVNDINQLLTPPNNNSEPYNIFINEKGDRMTTGRLTAQFSEDINNADPERCQANLGWLTLQDRQSLRSLYEQEENMCLSSSLEDSIVTAFSSIGHLGGHFDLRNLITLTTSLDQGLDDYIMGIIGGDCLDSGAQIPESLNCNAETMPRRNSSLSIPDQIRDTSNLLREKMHTSLTESNGSGRPVEISACTGFMKADSSSNANWPSFNCDTTRAHGMHSMTVTGYRCRQGGEGQKPVVQYLVQNSWGSRCTADTATNESEANFSDTDTPQINCNDINREQGSFWVDEDILAKNLTNISTMSN
ncbi:MAG: hypothetical protein HOJ35_10965 [Bdellovibrionales bacterium]|nr:hypothetical protein [Bdellovibrionales bacterium]